MTKKKVTQKQMKKYPLSEIFYSIQGEGINIGSPAVFVRFFGCNLDCTWCDTKYATGKAKGEKVMMTVDEIVAEIKELIQGVPLPPDIIFTGGEPMMYQQAIRELSDQLVSEHILFVETNGTLPIEQETKHYPITYMVSPKLKSSGNKKAIDPDILCQYTAMLEDAFFKFVITDSKDFLEISKIVQDTKLLPTRIYLMPEGVETDEMMESTREVWTMCLKLGMMLSPRLHILFFGNKRGR